MAEKVVAHITGTVVRSGAPAQAVNEGDFLVVLG